MVEGNVPNAAAMIVLGPQKIPERVIAYNAGFMQRVSEATMKSDWAALSNYGARDRAPSVGHTLVPGGSQPPVELEADKFSGFVLSKMGADLDDAQKAVATLVAGGGRADPSGTRQATGGSRGGMERVVQPAARRLSGRRHCHGSRAAGAVTPPVAPPVTPGAKKRRRAKRPACLR